MNIEATMTATETADNAAAKNPDVLRQAVIDAEQRCADLRATLQKLIAERGAARAVLADAIGAWSGLDRRTPEANAREYIRHEIAERARLAKHGPDAATQPTPGNSVIDRIAVYGAGGNASDFARKQMRTGFRRGAAVAALKNSRLPRA